MREVVLASGNAGKLAELRELLAGLPVSLRAQGEFGVGDADESGTTFVENAIIKARHAATATARPAIADDSGLVVPALAGAPGVRSARYAGPDAGDAANVARLLEALRAQPGASRRCCFVCVMVYLRHAADPLPLIASAEWWGEVLEAPRGARGFGYDPVFLAPERGCAAAELEAADKNRLSHRGRAVAALVAALGAELRRDGA
ncbi:MAG: RdgB/HAM1 family non-canonical purine NTP pyrophosphatase [Gammaproteobacteria bacterium]|nr:RdgB/HAM1 family non-canonical purine NTP pyrophosphatase [Gammaproteobacteria bacterium]